MLKLLLNILILVSIVAISSCNKTELSNNEIKTNSADTTIMNNSDSVTLSEGMTSLPGKLNTVESALEYINCSKDSSKFYEGIFPRMIEENLDYAERLLNSEFDHFIVVDKGRMKVILYDKYGREVLNYGMACGKKYGTKHKKADSRTPEGFFTAEGVYDSTDWLFTDDNGVTSNKKGQFGPRFIRIKTPVTMQIGIHGTCAPWSIGGRVSHGCIRVTNENILELVNYVEVGMPVIVSPGGRDMGVNEAEGYDIPAVTTGENRIKLIKPRPEDLTGTVISNVLRDTINSDTINNKLLQPDSIATIINDSITTVAPDSVE